MIYDFDLHGRKRNKIRSDAKRKMNDCMQCAIRNGKTQRYEGGRGEGKKKLLLIGID